MNRCPGSLGCPEVSQVPGVPQSLEEPDEGQPSCQQNISENLPPSELTRASSRGCAVEAPSPPRPPSPDPTQCHPWPGSHPDPNPSGPDSAVCRAPGSGGCGRDANGPAEALTPARPFSLCPVPRLLLLVCFVNDN